MRIFLHIISSIILTLSLTLLLASCSKKEVKQEPGSPDAKALRIGILPMTICKPFTDAYDKGLLDSLHADIALKQYNAFSECRYAILHNLVDFAVMDASLLDIINSSLPEEQKLRSMPIVVHIPVFHFLTSKKARIQRFSQMTDKVIGADSHGTTHDIAAAAIDSLLRHKQLVFIVQCEDMKVRTDMLISGNIDAAVIPEPFASKALKEGATEIPIPNIKQSQIVLAFSPRVKTDQIIKIRKVFKIF